MPVQATKFTSPYKVFNILYVFSVTCASQYSGLVYNIFPLKEHPPINFRGDCLLILILIKVLVIIHHLKDAANKTCNLSQIVSVRFIPLYWGHLNIKNILKAQLETVHQSVRCK